MVARSKILQLESHLTSNDLCMDDCATIMKTETQWNGMKYQQVFLMRMKVEFDMCCSCSRS